MPSGDARQRRSQKASQSGKDKQSKAETDKQSSRLWIRPFVIAFIVSIIAFVIGFILMPSPVDPVEYVLPDPVELTGSLEPNDILKSAERLFAGKLIGPESIVVDNDHIYVSTADGWVNDVHKGEVRQLVRFGKGPCGGIENENTCGRPLGMRMDKNGFLIVVDAYFGLFQVNVATGDYEVLYSSSTPVNGKLPKLINDLDIGPDGKIYFSHSSSNWHRNRFPMIFLEGQANGRLLEYDPKTKKVTELMDGLLFANGVQLTKDKTAVLVAETFQSRIWKYDLKSGKSSVWVDRLPGFPDNIRYSKSSGTYWLGIAIVRQKGRSLVDALASKPWLRGQLAKIFSIDVMVYLSKRLTRTDTAAMAIELNEAGTITRSIQDRTGEVIERVSEVESSDGVLYFGSFNSPYLGRLYTKRVPGF